jgi:hypothetical protein
MVLLLASSAAAWGEPSPTLTPTPSIGRAPLRERLRQPLGSPRKMGGAAKDTPMLHFKENVDVVVPSLDFKRLRAEWTRHWNLSGREGAATGPPTHAELQQHSRYLSRIEGVPLPQGLPLMDLALAAGKALAKRATRKAMPPAGPPPTPTPRRPPLEVVVVVIDNDDALAFRSVPTPSPDATGTADEQPLRERSRDE